MRHVISTDLEVETRLRQLGAARDDRKALSRREHLHVPKKSCYGVVRNKRRAFFLSDVRFGVHALVPPTAQWVASPDQQHWTEEEEKEEEEE